MLRPEGEGFLPRSRSPYLDVPDDQTFLKRPRSPITKRVDHVFYESGSKIATNPWSTPPEFLKVFSDTFAAVGTRVELECVLFGNPRPRITWLKDGHKLCCDDRNIDQINTNDTCKLVILRVDPSHYGEYAVLAENEVGQANAQAKLMQE